MGYVCMCSCGIVQKYVDFTQPAELMGMDGYALYNTINHYGPLISC